MPLRFVVFVLIGADALVSYVFMKINNRAVFEGVRFILGGLSSMAVCWGSFFILLKIAGLHYLICTNLSTFIAWGYAYFINKYLVFRDRRSEHAKQGRKYLILQGLLLATSNVLMYLQIDVWGWSLYVALFLMSVIVTAINFFALKLIVFAVKPELRRDQLLS